MAEVLNAFRHQRLLHSRVSSRYRPSPACSTPFGIRGSCTQGPWQGPCRTPYSAQRLSASEAPAPYSQSPATTNGRVLNAFRHQRLLHGYLDFGGIARYLCSTPFGIRGSCTSARRPGIRRETSAQRLSASEAPAPANFVGETGLPLCSTPFGIRGSCTSASTVARFWAMTCSTPFGIRGSCTDLLGFLWAR